MKLKLEEEYAAVTTEIADLEAEKIRAQVGSRWLGARWFRSELELNTAPRHRRATKGSSLAGRPARHAKPRAPAGRRANWC